MNYTKFGIVSLLLALSLVLAACPAPTAPPAADGDMAGEDADDGDMAGEDADDDDMAMAGCEDELGCIEVAAGAPIEVVGMGPYSGPVAFLGEDSKGGIELATAARGEIMGHEVVLSFEDSTCNAEGGQTAAQKVAANPNVTGVIGTSCSGAAAAALPVLSAAGMLMISPANTSPMLTNANPDDGGLWLPGYYRTAHNDLFQGGMAAQYAYEELGARTAATIHDGDPYTDGLQGAFADAFAALGGEVLYQGAINKGDTDMRPILTEISSNAPDIMYYPLFEPEVNFMVAQKGEFAELAETVSFLADAALVDAFPENTGDAVLGVYLSGPYLEPEGPYVDLLAAWEAEYGGVPPSGFHAHAYDATNMLFDAIEAVGVDNGDGSLTIGRMALRSYLDNLSGFEGLTGVLTCNETGDCATGEALGVYQISQAELDGAWPPAVLWQP